MIELLINIWYPNKVLSLIRLCQNREAHQKKFTGSSIQLARQPLLKTYPNIGDRRIAHLFCE